MKGAAMKEETKSTNTKKQGGFAINELPFKDPTLGATVVTGAIGDPKVPPFRAE